MERAIDLNNAESALQMDFKDRATQEKGFKFDEQSAVNEHLQSDLTSWVGCAGEEVNNLKTACFDSLSEDELESTLKDDYEIRSMLSWRRGGKQPMDAWRSCRW